MHILLFLCILFGMTGISVAESGGGGNGGKNEYQNVVSFLNQRCYKCHGASLQKADLRFDTLTLDLDNEDVLLTWQNMLDMLNLGLMPPYEEPQPELEELKPVVDWITATLKAHYDEEKSTDGEVVLRRLNRKEYRNTIRDLFHLDMTVFDPTEEFPADDVEEGFDNIGRTLVMSDFLLTQYLNAADKIVDRIVFDTEKPRSRKRKFDASALKKGITGPMVRASMKMRKGAEFVEIFQKDRGRQGNLVPRPLRRGVSHHGMYRIRVRASAHNKDHPYRNLVQVYKHDPISIHFLSKKQGNQGPGTDWEGTSIEKRFEMIADGKPRDYEALIRLDKGYFPSIAYGNGPGIFYQTAVRLLRKYHPDLYVPLDSLSYELRLNHRLHYYETLTKAYKGPTIRVYEMEFEGPIYDEWPSLTHRSILGNNSPDEVDIHDVLLRFANRAYRRPVSKEDIEYTLNFADKLKREGESPEHIIKMGIKTILCSPNFLYLYQNEGKLDEYAVASKLSYFLWSSMPDEELIRMAKERKLHKPEVLSGQIDRMLKDDKAQAFAENFTERWLALYKVGEMPPDPRNFRIYYKRELENVIKKETHHFFKYILDNNLDIENFIDSDFTFVNRDLAALYGIDGINDKAFRKVSLTGSQRGGLLGHASILTATSNGIETSPVMRGVWILENLLGTPPSPPPPDVEPLEPDIRGSTTIRELLANHRKIDTCNECHRHIDPLGFALENYNPVGAWRSRYGNGKPAIDPSDTMSDGTHFETLAEFKKILMGKKDQFAHCLTEKMLTYATGRTLESTDRPEIDRIVHELKEQGYGLKDLVLLIAMSEPFLTK